MNASGSASNLVQAARDLSGQWQQTKVFWRDVKSQDFQRQYIDVLPAHIDQTVAVLEELNHLLKKVRGECE